MIPTINYSSVPGTLTLNNPITPLVPVITGGTAVTKTLVSTIAGVTTPSLYIQNQGYNNGNPATFVFPLGLATMADGTSYVLETDVPVVRKVNTLGVTSEFSGSSRFVSPSYTGYGYVDGAPSFARFNNARGLAPGSDGNIYMADTFNRRIRQVDPTGYAKTVAGSGVSGIADGISPIAQFKSPNALCLDSVGNIYVADEHRVRKIDTLGNVTTITGAAMGNAVGTVATARFRNIDGITTDNFGTLYVSDSGNNVVKKINLNTGLVTTLNISVTETVGSTPILYSLGTPSGIVFSNGSLFVADRVNHIVFRVNSLGQVTRYAGNGMPRHRDGASLATTLGASFYTPEALSADGVGNIYVTDKDNHRIKKIVATANPYSIYPALPNGLVFNTTTGVISGIPTQGSSSTTYTVTANNYDGASTTSLTFQVT